MFSIDAFVYLLYSYYSSNILFITNFYCISLLFYSLSIITFLFLFCFHSITVLFILYFIPIRNSFTLLNNKLRFNNQRINYRARVDYVGITSYVPTPALYFDTRIFNWKLSVRGFIWIKPILFIFRTYHVNLLFADRPLPIYHCCSWKV